MQSVRYALTVLQNRLGAVPRPAWCTYLVSYRCNARCPMCDSWRLRPGQELTVPQVRTVFGKNVSDLMRYKGLPLEAAAAEALQQIQALGGHGGAIAIDRDGHVYMDFNTASMYRGFVLSDGTSDVQLFGHTP